MIKYINSEASQHEMKLTQMGAQVRQINGKMHYVKFEVGNVQVAYVYNINSKNKYFLERVKPYPLPIKEFDNEDDVLQIIEIDIKQFQNACCSRNIDDFIKINQELNLTIKEFEDLFLYYNVPEIETEIIMNKISEIHKEIYKTKQSSKRVFFEKDPENI